MMRTLIVVAALLSLSVPAALAAPPADKGKPESPGKSAAAPGQSADKNAAKKCKAERGTTSRPSPPSRTSTARTRTRRTPSASACRHGEEGRGRRTAEEQQAERTLPRSARRSAGRRPTASPPSRPSTARTPNKANAFGKCVSKLAKAAARHRELSSQIRNGGGGTGCGGRGKRRRRSRGLLRRSSTAVLRAIGRDAAAYGLRDRAALADLDLRTKPGSAAPSAGA